MCCVRFLLQYYLWDHLFNLDYCSVFIFKYSSIRFCGLIPNAVNV